MVEQRDPRSGPVPRNPFAPKETFWSSDLGLFLRAVPGAWLMLAGFWLGVFWLHEHLDRFHWRVAAEILLVLVCLVCYGGRRRR